MRGLLRQHLPGSEIVIIIMAICLTAKVRFMSVKPGDLDFLSSVSILLLTRDIDIVILSVCLSVCP